jgi:copper(I)-binding protein
VIRSSRRSTVSRRVLITVAAALVPLIAGCEAGTNAPSLQWHQPTDGTGKVVGDITISNAFVLGARLGAVLQQGQNAGLFLGLVNTGSPDRLLGIRTPGVAGSALLPGGRILLLHNHSVLLTGPRPAVILQDLTRPLTGGSVVTIYLEFQKAGTVKLQVPVMPRTQAFATLHAAPAAAPTVTPSPTPSPSGT